MPLQPVRELDNDVIMEDDNSAGSNLQPQIMNDQPRQDNMLAYDSLQAIIRLGALFCTDLKGVLNLAFT